MMDFEKKREKKTGIIDTTQTQADIYSNPVMDTRSVQKNEYQHIIEPMSVNDLMADKNKGYLNKGKNANLINNEIIDLNESQDDFIFGDPNIQAENYVRRPVPHLSRKLYRSMKKILNWEGGKSADYAQPILDEINAVLRADSESTFIDSMRNVIDRCVLYIQNRPGVRNRLGKGNQRKADIVDLLKEIANFEVNGNSNMVYEATSKADLFAVQNEGTRAYQEAINEATQKRFGNKLDADHTAAQLAEQADRKMVRDLEDWGGCNQRAADILAARQDQGNQQAASIPEFELKPEMLKAAIENIRIPDTRALDDYALLTYPGIENLRQTLYIPLLQNLEKTIADGGITDMNEVMRLRARMETLRMQLDLYDARLKVMAGEDDLQGTNAALVRNAQFSDFMEKANRASIYDSMKAPGQIREYKAYMKIINRNKKIDQADLANRLLVIEQNRARQSYITRSRSLAKKPDRLFRSDDEDVVERYKSHRTECNKILTMDFSLLFDTAITENGLLSNYAKRRELLLLLADLDSFMKTVDSTETKLSNEQKDALNNKRILLTEPEKQELNGLVEIGKLMKTYMEDQYSYMTTQPAYPVLASSDYHDLPEGPAKQRLLQRPGEFRLAENENNFRVFEAFDFFKRLGDTRNKLSNEFANKVFVLKGLRDLNVANREYDEYKEQERLRREEEALRERQRQEEEERRERQRQKEAKQRDKQRFNRLKDALDPGGLKAQENPKYKGEESYKNFMEQGMDADVLYAMKYMDNKEAAEEERRQEIERRKEEERLRREQEIARHKAYVAFKKEFDATKPVYKKAGRGKYKEAEDSERETFFRLASSPEDMLEVYKERQRKAQHKWFVETRTTLGKTKPAYTKLGEGIYKETEDYDNGTEHRIKTDPALMLKEFDYNDRKRLVKDILSSYKALSGDDAREGDEIKVRETCVKTISDFTGIKEKDFELVPTDVIIGKLATIIDGKKEFNAKAFSEDVSKMLEGLFEDGDGISDVLVPLCKEKKHNLAEDFKIREYSMAALDKCVDLYVRDRGALEKTDPALLSKIAVGLLSIKDIDLQDEDDPTFVPEEKDVKKVVSTSVILLSLLTGKDKSEYEFIPVADLSNLMYEAVSAIGSEIDIPKYVEEQVIIEKRKKVIRDGFSLFDAMDKNKVSKAEMDKARGAILDALVNVTGIEESSFDLLPVDRLYELLVICQLNAEDEEALKDAVSKDLKEIDETINVGSYGEIVKDLNADQSVSQGMKDYLSCEYSINCYIKLLDKLGWSGDKKLSRNDFDFDKTGNLSQAIIMGYEFACNDPDLMDEEKSAAFREMASGWIGDVTGINKEAFSDIPLYDLKKMTKELILSAKDKDTFEKTVKEIVPSYEKRYQKDAIVSELSQIMGRASAKSKPDLRDLKEVAAHYLLDKAKVEDFTREELMEIPGMTLFTMVMEQATKEKETVPVYDASKDTIVIGYIRANEKLGLKKQELLTSLAPLQKTRDDAIAKVDKKIAEQQKKTKPGKENKKLTAAKAERKVAERINYDAITELERKISKIENQILSNSQKANFQISQMTKDNQAVAKRSVAKEALMFEETREAEDRYQLMRIGYDPLDRNKLTEEKVWSDNAQKTLTLIGDLVSVEKLFDKNGTEIPAHERTRVLLLNNAELITVLLNERRGKDAGPGVVDEIGNLLSGAEERLVSSIIGTYLDKLLGKFEEIGAGKEKWTKENVSQILDGAEMASYLNGADATLSAAIKSGDTMIDNMISEAAENLFSGAVDADDFLEFMKTIPVDLEQLFGEEAVKHFDELSKEKGYDRKTLQELEKKMKEDLGLKELIPQDVSETTDKEKLERLRDAVFDMNKGQGKFLYKVIKNYYSQAPMEQRRFMMSYLLKDLKPTVLGNSARGKGAAFFASMLKGAGPLMQKLFQGIPEHMLMKEFKPALSVVKSDLREISPEFVDKTLLQLKKDANDNFLNNQSDNRVKSITKIRSLGAASIAETFLCDVVYSNGTNEKTRQVVVKILRPDVNLARLEQEKQFIEKCAKETDDNGVMLNTFTAHYNKILEELNFKTERNNAITGGQIYKSEDGKVRSVKISGTFPSGKNYLVMNKAEGMTADRYIDQLKAYSADCLKEFSNFDPASGRKYSAGLKQQARRMQVRKEVADKLIEAEKCQENMEKLVHTWIEQALFKSMGDKQYFHHGDLHAGNIMVNKDYVTVLDYGNCTTLDNNSKKVDNIIKMMAAAFKGFSDDFIEFLESFIASDKGNEYNSLKKNEKKELKGKLKKELEQVFKLGEAEDTGERIFVALLKAQEVGFKLPKEMLNFSQCQQRLENSLNEFNNAIDELRTSLSTIDRMAVPELMAKDKYIFNPVHSLYSKMYLRNNVYGDTQTLVEQTYVTYKVFDREAFRKVIRDTGNQDKLRSGELYNYCMVKRSMDSEDCKANFEKLHKNLVSMKKRFGEYKSFEGVEKKDIKEKSRLKRFEEHEKMKEEMCNVYQPLDEYAEILALLGGANRLSSLAWIAGLQYDEDSFDELYDLLETKLNKMYEVGDKYEKYIEAVNEKKDSKTILKLENDFLDKMEQMYDDDALDRREIQDISRDLSPDLVQTLYSTYSEQKIPEFWKNADNNVKGNLLTKTEVKDEKGNIREEFRYGEVAKKLSEVKLELQALEKEKNPSDEQKKRVEELTNEAVRLINICIIKRITVDNRDHFEEAHEEYFTDETSDGEIFRSCYKELRELQDQYIDAKTNKIPSEQLATLKKKRIEANKKFFRIYRAMTEKKLRPIYEVYKDYKPKNLGNFVTAMENIIRGNKGTILVLLKGKTFRYIK